MNVQGLKLTSGPNRSMLEGMAMVQAQQSQAGFLFSLIDPIDFHVVSYFAGGSLEQLGMERDRQTATTV